MTAVDQLLGAFIAEHRAGGEADPRTFLVQASANDRRELAALIDAYLASAPRQPFVQPAFAGSSAERTVDALERSLAGQAGLWPSVLPRLRTLAGLRRSNLVEQLAAALDLRGREEKVGYYYHLMEQGLLASSGVSDRVLSALGQIVGETAEALREAGRSLAGPGVGGESPGTMFARRGSDDATQAFSRPAEDAPGDWDDVDELFRGS